MTTTHTTPQDMPQVPVRLDFDRHAAGYSRALAHLDKAATRELDRVDLDPRLRELVRVRASQLNGCAYCIDMHTKDARAIGETEQRLYALPAWRDSRRAPSDPASTGLEPSCGRHWGWPDDR